MFNRLTDPFCHLFGVRQLATLLLGPAPSTPVRRTWFSGVALNYRAAILSILFILVITPLGLANTFYVSTTGNDWGL